MATGDVIATHAKVNTNPDDNATALAGGVVNSDWNADHTFEGMSELLGSVRDVVIINMAGGDYEMSDEEAIASAKVILGEGASSTLTWPTSSYAYLSSSQTILGGFLANNITLAYESGGGTSTFIAGSNSEVILVAGDNFTVMSEYYATYSRTLAPDLLTMPSAALTGAAGAGTFEYLTNTGYFTPSTDNRGVMPAIHHSINTSAKSLSNSTSAQGYLNTGTLTLVENTTYFFDTDIYLDTGSTSTNISFLIAGTATISDIKYSALSVKSGADTRTTPIRSWNNSPSAMVVATSNANTQAAISIRGTMVVSMGGTVIPQISFGAAPGGTNESATGSYFKCYAAGSNTTATVGNWS